MHLPEVTQLLVHYRPVHPGAAIPSEVSSPLPTAHTLSSFENTPQWAVADPAHRDCVLGEACKVTEDKFCVRTIWQAKLNHAYGRCGPHTNSPGHVLCRDFSEAERQLYPSCADCGVLVEIRDLVLVHLRMLSQTEKGIENGVLGSPHEEAVRDALAGYVRAYEMLLTRHTEGLLGGPGALQGLKFSHYCGEMTARSVGWLRRLVRKIGRMLGFH